MINDFKLRYEFTLKLYELIYANVELIKALEIIKDIDRKRIMKVKKSLEKGNSITKSFSFVSKNKEFLNYISYSEKTGDLLNSLALLKDKYEFRKKLITKLISISIYPIIVILMCIIILNILLIFVVPKFEQIYSSMNISMPYITSIIIKLSNNLGENILKSISLFLFITILIYILIAKNKKLFHRLVFKISIIRNILMLNYIKSVYFLLKSRIDLVDALKIVNIENIYLKKALVRIIKKLEKGEDVYKSFKNENILENKYLVYLKISEKTGDMIKTFENISISYENEVNKTIDIYIKLFEPLSIVLIAIIVGTITIAIMLPLFNIQGGI